MENNLAMFPGWRIVREIGRGSFGAVYEIERKLFEDTEKAALKVISIPRDKAEISNLRQDEYDDASITAIFEDRLQGILKEYMLMRKLNGNTNVVNCDDVVQVQHDDGFGWDVYIKMELLTPLKEALPRIPTQQQVIKIGSDMCNALILCEDNCIIHRDIKPENIFVSPHGAYKLGDFGVSKTMERTTTGTTTGTYNYMAPEVSNYQPYNHTADLYSLGIVLYWLLNERRGPFLPLPPAIAKANDHELARARRMRGDTIPAPKYGSDALKAVVLKACAFDPKDRYQSAREMKKALDALLQTEERKGSAADKQVVQTEHVTEENTERTISGRKPDIRKKEAPVGAEVSGTVVDRTERKNSASQQTPKAEKKPDTEEKTKQIPPKRVEIKEEAYQQKAPSRKSVKSILLIILILCGVTVFAYGLGIFDAVYDRFVYDEAFVDDAAPAEAFAYHIEADGTVTIEALNHFDDRRLVIPETLEGKPVTKIEFAAFCGADFLEEVILPDTVKIIESDVFNGCTGLERVSLGNSLVSIGHGAFNDCTSLQEVVLPETLESIDYSAFNGCTSLTKIVLPDSLTKLGNSAFFHCTALTDVTIGNSLSVIGNNVFTGCTALKTITIPDSVEVLGNGVFYQCSGLQTIHFGNGLISIGNNTFLECSALEAAVLPDTVKQIGDGAFRMCGSLTEISLGDSVETIGESAFYGCSSLNEILIPASVVEIGNTPFSECPNLKDIYYEGSEDDWNRVCPYYDYSYQYGFVTATVHYNYVG
ncbi:MAG: leucine-rich repeat protein [Oscillospiraceae bacterium]|nr:leucine-rich repeat protein [Oscillospiraceae bacterium]